ncbi:MAG: hypothetical protein WDM88_05555 [Galbitalea sp.]
MPATEPAKSPAQAEDVTPPSRPRRRFGIGRVLITVYAILAIGATSRAIFQIVAYYPSHPSARLPITLSAVSGVIYILATVALIAPGRTWYRVAWITISFELAGVVIIGDVERALPEHLRRARRTCRMWPTAPCGRTMESATSTFHRAADSRG